jgi:hypothetical protein
LRVRTGVAQACLRYAVAPDGRDCPCERFSRRRAGVMLSHMSTETPAPPEAKRIDTRIDNLLHQGREKRLARRWAEIGVVGILVVWSILLTLAIVFYDQDSSLVVFPVYGAFGGFVGGSWLVFFIIEKRNEILALERDVSRLRTRRREVLAGRWDESTGSLARHKEFLPLLVDGYRLSAVRYRRRFTALQLAVIVGSLSSSAVTAAAGARVEGRSGAIALSLIVGVAASIALTFKPKERAAALQTVADDIEHESRSMELRIGAYAKIASDAERLLLMAERVEDLRVKQAAKDRELDLPPEFAVAVNADLAD